MAKFSLHKSEKLCSEKSIDALFASKGRGALAFPLRMVAMENPGRSRGATVQFLISVPKKRLRHAVDRVTMRRRIREAYRLNRHDFTDVLTTPLDVAFIYVAPKLMPYSRVESAMKKLLEKCATFSSSPSDSTSC